MEPYQIILLGLSAGVVVNGIWRVKKKQAVIAFLVFTATIFDILLWK